MSLDQKQADRSELLKAVASFGLPVSCRPLSDFDAIDDGVLYAQSDSKAAIVCICEDVAWGPKFSSYVEPADEFRSIPVLMLDIPNFLDGRIPEVMQALQGWFAD